MNESKKGRVTEQIEVAGDQLVGKVKELYADGKTRRIVLHSEDGKELFRLPMNVGVIGGGVLALASPVIAAVGAVAALATKVRIDVVREGDDDDPQDAPAEDPTNPS